MNNSLKIWQCRGLRVVCDRNRVVPDDPGADTPAMVYYKCRQYEASATYWCAMGESHLQINSGKFRDEEHKLTQTQCEWLDSLEPEITEFLYKTNPVCCNGKETS